MLRAGEMQLAQHELDDMAGAFRLSHLTSLGGYENAVFRADRPQPSVLRVTHSTRRTASEIAAEMQFLSALDGAGVGVATPLRTNDGDLVLTYETGESGKVHVIATLFADGRHRHYDELSDSNLTAYGELIGRMHQVSAELDRIDRPDWDEPIETMVGKDLDGRHPDVLQRAVDTMEQLRVHPAGGRNLLVHEDPHLGNVFVTDDGKFTLFDFDDSGYGTATFDLAMVILYWIAGRPLPEPALEVRRMLEPFLDGYTKYFGLETDWKSGADLHMKLRELELYAALVDTDLTEGGWDAAFMASRRDRIDQDVPFLGAPLAEVLN